MIINRYKSIVYELKFAAISNIRRFRSAKSGKCVVIARQEYSHLTQAFDSIDLITSLLDDSMVTETGNLVRSRGLRDGYSLPLNIAGSK